MCLDIIETGIGQNEYEMYLYENLYIKKGLNYLGQRILNLVSGRDERQQEIDVWKTTWPAGERGNLFV